MKGIAYEGLLRKKEFSNKTDLTLKAIHDKTYQIDYQPGCLAWIMDIGKYLVQNVLLIDNEIQPRERLPDFGLTEIDKEKILSEFIKLQVKKE